MSNFKYALMFILFSAKVFVNAAYPEKDKNFPQAIFNLTVNGGWDYFVYMKAGNSGDFYLSGYNTIVRMFIKRLEIANKKCEKQEDCDESFEWDNFHKKYHSDRDFNEFFEEWDKDEWHKHKNECKRFVTDEALGIISSDVNWHIKGLGDDIWQEYKKEHNPYIHPKSEKLFK